MRSTSSGAAGVARAAVGRDALDLDRRPVSATRSPARERPRARRAHHLIDLVAQHAAVGRDAQRAVVERARRDRGGRGREPVQVRRARLAARRAHDRDVAGERIRRRGGDDRPSCRRSRVVRDAGIGAIDHARDRDHRARAQHEQRRREHEVDARAKPSATTVAKSRRAAAVAEQRRDRGAAAASSCATRPMRAEADEREQAVGGERGRDRHRREQHAGREEPRGGIAAEQARAGERRSRRASRRR